ncbi:MAG: transglutaminase-like domain-containing protein [Dehalococcoidia bacterium]
MDLTHDELLTYYMVPGPFTTIEGFEEQIDAVRSDIGAIAKLVQGLLVHEAWASAYTVELSPERRAEKQLHGAEAMLTCAVRIDGRPLAEGRPPDRRVVGVCRHFATLFVACLRRKGIPARARCGFANYFKPGENGDHWVGEYWNAGEQRWILVDAQIDELQAQFVKPDFDVLDVPRTRFLVAGDAWAACRSGAADPMTFGVGGTDMWGLLEVFGYVLVDLAALQKIELLPWGWYGLAKEDGALEAETELIDDLARLSSAADPAALGVLRTIASSDDRLRVPAETLSAIIAADRAGATAVRSPVKPGSG